MGKRYAAAVAAAAVGVSLFGGPAMAKPIVPSPPLVQLGGHVIPDFQGGLAGAHRGFAPAQTVTAHRTGAIKLGMSGRVAAKAGSLVAVSKCHNAMMGTDRRWLGMRMAFLDNTKRVRVIVTLDRGDHTRNGIHPGDTLRQVKRVFPNAALQSVRLEGQPAHVLSVKSGRDRVVIPFTSAHGSAKSTAILTARDMTVRQVLQGRYLPSCNIAMRDHVLDMVNANSGN